MKPPTAAFDFNPNGLPDDLLRAIGLMVAASAQTESIVQEFIGAVLQIDDAEMLAVTAHMSAPLKSQVARALIELNAKSATTIDHVDNLLDIIDELAKKRNVVVHNSFVRDAVNGSILSVREKARGSLQVELMPVTAEEITRDANAIYEAGLSLMRFMIDCGIRSQQRTRPLRAPLDRRKKAREARENLSVGVAK